MENSLPWDIFIIHTAEDHSSIAVPLARELTARGCRVWEDSFTLRLGVGIRQELERGLAQARYGILLLSPAFLGCPWQPGELDGLLETRRAGEKVMLSVWHGVEAIEVIQYFHQFSGRLAINASVGLDVVAETIAETLGFREAAPVEAPDEPQEVAESSPEDLKRFETFVALGRSGTAANVDFLMAELEQAGNIAGTRLVDYALSLVHARAGRARMEHYLFHGTQRQRNYAALYFKRRHNRKILQRAVAAGCVDWEQAFSK